VLDQPVHYVCVASQLAGGQPLLAIFDTADCEELRDESRAVG
jgi:hypothetical protein